METPEEQELRRKRARLATLEGDLAQRELELLTLQAGLRAFEVRYLGTVGVRYAALDALTAQIAEAQARRTPRDSRAREHAAQARAQAQESAEASQASGSPEPPRAFTPSEELKKLYREAAKFLHPDLVQCPINSGPPTGEVGSP
jgi:hypothetical protein